jgi:hypothetical protein
MYRVWLSTPAPDAFATCLQRESLARRALTSYPPTAVLGLGLLGGGGGAVLALAREPPASKRRPGCIPENNAAS